jgi:hypothetical protein
MTSRPQRRRREEEQENHHRRDGSDDWEDQELLVLENHVQRAFEQHPASLEFIHSVSLEYSSFAAYKPCLIPWF